MARFNVFTKISTCGNCKTILCNYPLIIIKSPKILFILVLWLISTVPLAYILNHWWHPLSLKASTGYFDLKIGNLLYYFSYFLAGVLLYSNQHFFRKLQSGKTVLVLGIISVFAFLFRAYTDYLALGGVEDLKNLAQLQFDPVLVFFNSLIIGVNTVCWCLFFIGLTSKFILSSSTILRWFVELSYPIYIVHIIPVVMMSSIFYRAGFNQVSIFILTIITGFIAVSYTHLTLPTKRIV